jgi:hypothetical protein
LSSEDKIPDHSAFSQARNERFRNRDMSRRVFERIVEAWEASSALLKVSNTLHTYGQSRFESKHALERALTFK